MARHDDAQPFPESVAQILESMTDAFVALDVDWHYTYVNRRAAEIFGRTPADMVGKHIWTEFPEGVGHVFHLAYERAMREQQPIVIEDYYPPYDSWFENRIYPSPDGLLIFFQDVTERKTAELELGRSEERYRVLVHALSDYVWTTDAKGNAMVSESWAALTGREARDPGWLDALHPDDRGHVLATWHASLKTGDAFDVSARVRGADGGWRHVRARGVPIWEGDRIREWTGVVFDITEQVEAEHVLRRAALEDALTSLPNRAVFLDRLSAIIARRRRALAAVLYIDIDRFKSLNDRFGHVAGDTLLCCVGERLRDNARPSDVVSRLSGDEFAVLCDELGNPDEAVAIARRFLEAIAKPIPEDDRLHATASIGVAFVGGDDDVGSVLRAGDAAMYRAKAHGGAAVEVFDERLRARVQSRLSIEHDLRARLDGGAIGLHYQPVVPLREEGIPTVEALLRWRSAAGEMFPAAEVISVAEQSGLIDAISSRVLHTACAQAAAWREKGIALRVAVNVGGRQLSRPEELTAHVLAALEQSGLAPAALALEITEHAAMEEVARVEEVVEMLRDIGVTLEIDDFGVGHSSLARLHRLSVDTLKIDRSFVAGLPDDRTSRRLVEAIVALAHAFGVSVVGEGVERPEQLQAARELGCDSVQGFGLARPVPAEDLEAALGRAVAAAAPLRAL